MKTVRFYSAAIFLLLSGLCLPLWIGCGSKNSEPKGSLFRPRSAKKEDKVVLRIEEATFKNSDFERYVGAILGDDQAGLTPTSLSRLYDKFVDDEILLKAARDRNLTLSEEEKKNYLIRLNAAAWTGDQKKDSSGLDIEGIFEKLLIEKYNYELAKDITVDDAEIGEYYELHKREFLESDRVKISQILLETEEKAVEVYKRVGNASEEEFRDIAGEVSAGPEASKGGEMGVFRVGELPFELEKVVFSLEEGEVSKVVESTYGFHIFRLDKRTEPELVSLADATPSIRVKVLDQKIKEALSQHVEELKKTLDWQPFPHGLSFAYERNST